VVIVAVTLHSSSLKNVLIVAAAVVVSHAKVNQGAVGDT